MIAEVVELLACPVCSEHLESSGAVLRCHRGHAFDVARQGYVNLRPPGGTATTAGDSAEMVEARERFLRAGHYSPLQRRLAAAAAEAIGGGGPAAVVDAGAGTGQHLARVLAGAGEDAVGVALDSSRYAARRAARAHPRAGAVVCDVWKSLPLRARCASVVLDVFAPRNGREFRRVLRPGGALLVVTPTARHLQELVAVLGLLRVDERKDERLEQELAEHFEARDRMPLEWEMELERDHVEALVGMGPSARHGDPVARMERLPAGATPVTVTASVTVSAFRPRRAPLS